MLWRGIFKLVEEMAELGQVLGKLCVVPEGQHWDERDGTPGQKPLRARFTDEMADVYAALDYMSARNLTKEEQAAVQSRRLEKLGTYHIWVLDGIEK